MNIQDENVEGVKLTREQMLELYKKTKQQQKTQGNQSTLKSSGGIRKALSQTDTNVVQRNQSKSHIEVPMKPKPSKTKPSSVTPAPETKRTVMTLPHTIHKHAPRTALRSVESRDIKMQNERDISYQNTESTKVTLPERSVSTSSTVSTTSSTESNVDELLQRLARESAKSVQLDIELESKTSEAVSLRHQIEDLQSQLKSYHETQMCQQSKEELLRQRIQEIQQEYQNASQVYQDQIQSLNISLSEKDLFIHELEGIIAGLRNEIAQLQSTQANALADSDAWMYQLRIEELETSLASAREEQLHLTELHQKLEDEVKECYECIDVLERQEKQYEEQEKAFAAKIESLEAEVLALQATAFAKEQDLVEQSKDLEAVRDALAETLKENEILHGQSQIHSSRIDVTMIDNAAQTEIDLNALILEAQSALKKITMTEAKNCVLEQELKQIELQKNLEISELTKKLQSETENWKDSHEELMQVQTTLLKKLQEMGAENKKLKATTKLMTEKNETNLS